MKSKRFVALLLSLVMVFTLIGCGTQTPPDETGDGQTGTHYKEEIVIAMADEFTTIDPMETTAETNQIVQDCTHDLLTDTNLTTMENEGELVDHWEMVAPDHWIFYLKDNVTFHDGTKLNVDDVEFTFERAKDHAATANYMAMIKEFVKVDELTFEIYLTQGNVDFNYTLAANSLAILRLVPDPPGVVDCDKLEVNGQDILSMSAKELEKVRGKEVSMIFQDPMTALNPVFTVGDQIAESISIHENVSMVEAQKLAVGMLELVGIPGERAGDYPHQFSGGMKQRVVIAIALACHPQLLIADEPTTALDVTIQAQVLDLMKNLRKQYQTSLIMITHDLGIVAEICDEVAVMYAGNVVEQGTLEDVFNHTMHPYTEGLFNSLPNVNDRKSKLKPIPGLMPDPTALPEGCPFHPRCQYATEACKQVQEKRYVSDTHFIRCCAYDRPGFHIERKEKS